MSEEVYETGCRTREGNGAALILQTHGDLYEDLLAACRATRDSVNGSSAVTRDEAEAAAREAVAHHFTGVAQAAVDRMRASGWEAGMTTEIAEDITGWCYGYFLYFVSGEME